MMQPSALFCPLYNDDGDDGVSFPVSDIRIACVRKEYIGYML